MAKQDDDKKGAEPPVEDEVSAAGTIVTETEQAKETTVAEQPQETAPVSPPRRFWRRGLIVGVVVIIGLAAVAGGFVFARHTKKTQNIAPQVTTDQLKQRAVAPQPAKVISTEGSIDGNTYLDALKPLGDLGMYKDPEGYFGNSCDGQNHCKPSVARADIKYYQMGTAKNGDDIDVVTVPGQGPADLIYVLIGKTGRYRVLDNYTGAYSINDLKWDTDNLPAALSTGFTLDSSTKIEDLLFPNPVTVSGQPMASFGVGFPLLTGLNNMAAFLTSKPQSINKIGQKGLYTFYQAVTKDDPTFRVVNLYGTINGVWANGYRPDFAGITSEESTHQPIVWATGDDTSAFYFSGGQGCSALGYVVAKNIEPGDLIRVGTLEDAPVYQLPTSHPLVQEVYNKDYDPAGSGYLQDKSLANLSIDQFTAKHGYVIMRNNLGEYVLLQRSDMFQRGGCAKPVVYLYPTTPTPVNVQIGAQVTKSDPHYETNGWQGVLAQPNGSLSYRGGTYSSLFWEGYGYGPYPDITTGTVVPTALAASTIRAQLAEQGLSSTEINDFMVYWEPKLPTNKPFTRLIWLTKPQIDALAPLQVAPKPQTVIRVFLDFEGEDFPKWVLPQTLIAPERRGFTVVEWGGLARTGL